MATNAPQAIKRIQKKLEPIGEELDLLISDLQDRYDNMSETQQSSERGETLQYRIDTLSEWHDQLTDMYDEEV